MADLPELQKIRQGENLLKQVKTERPPLPRGFWKLLGFEIVAVLLAYLSGLFYGSFLDDRTRLLVVLSAAALWFVASALTTLLTAKFSRRLALILLETAAFLLPFRNAGANTLLIAAAVLVIFLFWGDLDARREYANSMKFRFRIFGRLKFGKMLTGALLAALIIYLPQVDENQPLLTEAQFGSVFTSTAASTKTIYPDVDLRGTVGDFVRAIVKRELMRNQDFAVLPPDVQDKEIAAAAEVMRANAEKSLGINLAPETALEKAFYDYLVKMLQGWRESFGGSFDIFWILFLFIIIRGIGVVFVWLAQIISILVYEALLATGVLALVGESQTKELVVFS